ncbi:MAG: hypothetical protein AVDCRST_MAG52-3176, partial [uncultured Blastococcus sp.]
MTQPRGDVLGVVVRRLPLYTLAAFLFGAVVLSLIAWTTYAGLTPVAGREYLDGPGWLDAWFQGDSGWYYAIADQGYSYTPGEQSPIAFFPVFPLLVHAVGQLLGGVLAHDRLVAVDLQLAGPGVQLEDEHVGVVEVLQPVVGVGHGGGADQHGGDDAGEGDDDDAHEDQELHRERPVGEPTGTPDRGRREGSGVHGNRPGKNGDNCAGCSGTADCCHCAAVGVVH